MTYDEAVGELFRAPHAEFVAERKRLAVALKAAGDKAGGTRLGKLGRPPISAWAVNQLWWREREAFDRLLATAARLRDGDLGGTADHRDALTDLRARAAAILAEAGHGGTESTLRRIATTLSAIAASGGFDPDPGGALTADRDPPGFEAAGIPGLAASVTATPVTTPTTTETAPTTPAPDTESRQRAAADAARKNAEAATEAAAVRRANEAQAQKLAARHRHEAALRTAKGDVERRRREVERLRAAVDVAEAALAKSEGIAADLESQLATLDADA